MNKRTNFVGESTDPAVVWLFFGTGFGVALLRQTLARLLVGSA